MDFLGYRAVNSVVYIPFTTANGSGGAVAPSAAFVSGDISIYKDGSAVQRSSAAGVTMTSPFDTVTGLHWLAIYTSDNTDAGFYAAGSQYTVVLNPATTTVDSQTIVKVLGTFILGPAPSNVIEINSSATAAANLASGAKALVTGTCGTSSTTTNIVSGLITATNQFAGKVITFENDTTTVALRGQSTKISSNDAAGNLTVVALTTAPVSGDTYTIA